MNDPNREQSCDAIVVGAGAIGLASAWRAAQRGLRVCVLDREQPGAGASGVAAGMLAPASEASWGEGELLSLNLASHRLWPEFAAEVEDAAGSEIGFRRTGALHVALDRDEGEELRRRHKLHTRRGLPARWLRSSECRRLEPGLAPAVSGGIEVEDEASVDPGLLCGALAAALERSGGMIEAGTDVVEARFGPGVTVTSADGRRWAAPILVLANGAWAGRSDWVPEGSRPPVRPVKGEILTLRGPAAEPLCERLVVTERIYVVPRDDGRVVVGATVEERGFDDTVTAGGVHELLRESYRALPDVAELELLEARAGLRPATPDNRPIIGRSAIDELLVASGHYRNGVLLAPVTADAVAALLAGEEPAVDLAPFSPQRFPSSREAVLR